MKTDLLTIPYVGKNTKEDLFNIGITCVEDLKGKSPEELYFNDCMIKNIKRIDVSYMYLEWPSIMLKTKITMRKN